MEAMWRMPGQRSGALATGRPHRHRSYRGRRCRRPDAPRPARAPIAGRRGPYQAPESPQAGAGRPAAVSHLLAGPGMARRPARLAHLPHPPRQPPGVGQGTAQEELDLGVGAAQLVGRPPGQGVVDRRVQAQQQALALTHVVTAPALTGTGSRC